MWRLWLYGEQGGGGDWAVWVAVTWAGRWRNTASGVSRECQPPPLPHPLLSSCCMRSAVRRPNPYFIAPDNWEGVKAVWLIFSVKEHANKTLRRRRQLPLHRQPHRKAPPPLPTPWLFHNGSQFRISIEEFLKSYLYGGSQRLGIISDVSVALWVSRRDQ